MADNIFNPILFLKIMPIWLTEQQFTSARWWYFEKLDVSLEYCKLPDDECRML